MAKIQYSIDDPGYPIMDGVGNLESLKHKTLRRHRSPVDKKVREKYGVGLVEYLFYQHWLYGKSFLSIAEEIGESRQVVSNLTRMLNIPVKEKPECFSTDFVRRRRVLGQKNRPINTYRNGATKNGGDIPGRRILYQQYWVEDMSGEGMAAYWNRSPTTIYRWMDFRKISRRHISEILRGRQSYKKGKSLEEIYGKARAERIRKYMRDAWAERKAGEKEISKERKV